VVVQLLAPRPVTRDFRIFVGQFFLSGMNTEFCMGIRRKGGMM